MLLSPVYAQYAVSPVSPGIDMNKSTFSLFDPSRFKMSHSYSLSYSSSRAGSYSLGMYLNSIEYQVSDPLKISLDIGYLHQPGRFFTQGSNAVQDGQIVPAFSIDWKPGNNFHFRLDYRQAPSNYNLYRPEFHYFYDDNKEGN